MTVLLIKTICCLFGAILSIFALHGDWWKNYRASTIFIVGFGWRWLLLIIWFFLLDGHATGDVIEYAKHVNRILDGQIPNRDFRTPYGVYLNYIFAIPYYWNRNPISIIFFIQLLEMLGVGLLFISLKQLWDEVRSKLFGLLYVCNPLVISSFAFDGQDEQLLVLGFALIVIAMQSSSRVIKWLVPAVIFLGVKITSLWMILPYVFQQNRIRDWLGMFGALALLAAPLFIAGSTVVGFNWTNENGEYTDLSSRIYSGNLWYIINEIFVLAGLAKMAKALTGITLAATTLIIYMSRTYHDKICSLALGTMAMTITFEVCSAFTGPTFLAMGIPALLIVLLIGKEDGQSSFTSSLVIFWCLFVSLDVPIYHRFINVLTADSFGPLKIGFISYNILIVIANITMAFWIFRQLLSQKKVDAN